MFKLNDKIVYPGHGIARVDEVIKKFVSKKQISFIKLTFIFKEMTILVPEYNIESVGLRYPSDQQVIDLVFQELQCRPERKLDTVDFTPSAWNRRNKDYHFRIQSGSILELAKIYRDLMYVGQQKDLSFGERSLLQTTESLISQELQVALKLEREVVIQSLRLPFKRLIIDDDIQANNDKKFSQASLP